MPIDRAGNSRSSARKIILKPTRSSFQDWVGKTDKDDFYQVRLGNRSHLDLTLSDLASNANLELLDRRGGLIQRSARSGTRKEAIQKVLKPGVYFIRVYQQSGKTRYRLSASTTPAPVRTSRFNIQFDYRFDTERWFTGDRKATLEAAAKVWETVIAEEFEAISVGTSLQVLNPQTSKIENFVANYPIDDLVVFVGSRTIDGNGRTQATGGPSGTWTSGSRLETRYNGSKFQPWTAHLSFDRAENWFFDPTLNTSNDIPRDAVDFFSLAVHELGHALGIGTSSAFNNLIAGNTFSGNSTKAENGDRPIPLASDLGHPAEGFVASGVGSVAAMNPTLFTGTRRLLNQLDLALLRDIGYRINTASTS
jgi:hypothetical protein